MLNIAKIALFLLAVALLVAVSSATAAPGAAQPEPLKIGMLLTLSGNYASAGADCRAGITAALVDNAASSRLNVIYADSKADPTTAISEFRKLMDSDHVLAVYTHRSNIGMAIDPVSQTAGISLLGAVGNKLFAANNNYAFQIWPKSDEEGGFFAAEFKKRGYKNVALLFTQDEWTTSVSDAFRSKFLSLGGSLIFDQAVLPAEIDFRTLLLQVKEKSPDVIFIDALLPQIGLLVNLIEDRCVKIPFVVKEIHDGKAQKQPS